MPSTTFSLRILLIMMLMRIRQLCWPSSCMMLRSSCQHAPDVSVVWFRQLYLYWVPSKFQPHKWIFIIFLAVPCCFMILFKTSWRTTVKSATIMRQKVVRPFIYLQSFTVSLFASKQNRSERMHCCLVFKGV